MATEPCHNINFFDVFKTLNVHCSGTQGIMSSTACHDNCKCKNCKNPKGVNPTSKYDLPPTLIVLTVSPGKLGLTLSVLPNGEGAKIVAIDPACTFKGRVEVGDRIVTIDGKRVEKLEDLTVGKEKMRKFGIAKEAQIIANKKAVAEAKAAAVA